MILQGVVLAAALLAAASVQTPAPFPAIPPQPTLGAHCPAGTGRAIGDPIGKGAYIRQEMQIVSAKPDAHLIGYVYDASDGNDYIDLTPTVPTEKVRIAKAGDFPIPGAFMRPCFADAFTQAWGQKR